uniref:Uncharacterized protein n=1 Tax=Picea glauca TaxID=3330 RepID=A0A124GME6_PICGL|nr:hypothetical protein ABT39_MTgene2690 [Picea glauca]
MDGGYAQVQLASHAFSYPLGISDFNQSCHQIHSIPSCVWGLIHVTHRVLDSLLASSSRAFSKHLRSGTMLDRLGTSRQGPSCYPLSH